MLSYRQIERHGNSKAVAGEGRVTYLTRHDDGGYRFAIDESRYEC